MLIIEESGWSAYESSLYYYNFSVNLKLLQDKVKRTDAILRNKMWYVQYKILNSQSTPRD